MSEAKPKKRGRPGIKADWPAIREFCEAGRTYQGAAFQFGARSGPLAYGSLAAAPSLHALPLVSAPSVDEVTADLEFTGNLRDWFPQIHELKSLGFELGTVSFSGLHIHTVLFRFNVVQNSPSPHWPFWRDRLDRTIQMWQQACSSSHPCIGQRIAPRKPKHWTSAQQTLKQNARINGVANDALNRTGRSQPVADFITRWQHKWNTSMLYLNFQSRLLTQGSKRTLPVRACCIYWQSIARRRRCIRWRCCIRVRHRFRLSTRGCD